MTEAELIFVRTMANNVWQPWQEVPHAGRLKTVGGQSIIGSGDIPSGVGVGQSWQDVTSSRATGVTYTNTTGKPITVSATFRQNGSSEGGAFAVVGGMAITSSSFSSPLRSNTPFIAVISFIIPNNTHYVS